MVVDAQTIITGGGVLTAVVAFITFAWKLFRWIDHQKEQDKEIARIEAKFDKEIARIEAKFDKEIEELKTEQAKAFDSILCEQTLIIYGLQACLKGLAEQGCDGPVTEAINKIDKHINKKAHLQE